MTINALLLEGFMTPCTLLQETKVKDGLGGMTKQWTDGADFMAAIVKDQTLAARVAEKQGVTEVYKVWTAGGIGLEYHNVFRRESDGETFRVTSNAIDGAAPKAATFAFEQVTAERWALT